MPLTEKKLSEVVNVSVSPKSEDKNNSKSLHDEIKEKLVAIGELLGFDSRSEVKIATGAVVDAIWEAKIGNMGKAIIWVRQFTYLKCSQRALSTV